MSDLRATIRQANRDAAEDVHVPSRRTPHTTPDDTAIYAAMASKVPNARRWAEDCWHAWLECPHDPRAWSALRAACYGYRCVLVDEQEAIKAQMREEDA